MVARNSARWSFGLTSALIALAVLHSAAAAPGEAPGDAIATSAPPASVGVTWQVATPDYAWSFPRDHWSHPGFRTEWWYFTGHLRGDAGREYGFQFTVFRVGLAPEAPALDSEWAANALFMGHASLTDVAGNRHVFADVLHREMPFLARFADWAPGDSILPVSADLPASQHPGSAGRGAQLPADTLLAFGLAAPGTDGRWTLAWNGSGFDFAMVDRAEGMALDLRAEAEKPMVFQGPNGFSRKGREEGAASLYYSFTRLRTTGWIELGGRRVEVQGTAWMDKEFGSNQLTADQVGWDWFSLQLDDGQELMLYLLRRSDGSLDFARGTWVGADGAVRYLDAGTWSHEATGSWTSPHTGIRYPSGWRVRVPDAGLDLELAPRVEGQENVAHRSGGLAYWEGAVEVRSKGRRVGLGYVELTGYGKGNRPPI